MKRDGVLAAAIVALTAILLASGADARSRKPDGVLPPPRPASLTTAAADVETTGSVVQIAQAGEPMRIAPAAAPALSETAVIAKANSALNSVNSMSADFQQVGGDGHRASGIVYVQRPGKVRFEYNKPSTMEVVSDGSTVLVRDRKLNTSDPYPIGQTPLKFLLSPRIDLARDTRVKSVGTTVDGVQVTIEDASTLGGTSRITLTFDNDVTTLKRWRVVDPQGYTTTVSLSDVEKNRALDPKIFMLNYSRPVD